MKRPYLSFLIAISSIALSFSAYAEPIWHCSRSPETSQDTKETNENLANISNTNFDESENRTIEIQIIDLLNAYSGGTVFMGDRPLAACFFDRASSLTAVAMSSIDVDPSSLASLSNSDAIVKSNIFPVRNEKQMETCIAKNHPAIGFLAEVVETDTIGPCF